MNSFLMDEIRKLYYSFDKTSNYYEKSYIWYVLYDLKEEFKENTEITKMFNDINSRSSVLYNQISKEDKLIQKYINDNTVFFNQQIVLPEKFSKYSDKELMFLTEEQLHYILKCFLESISSDLLNFYIKMKKEGRIIINSKTDHTLYTTLKSSDTLVFIRKFKNTQDILALLHELSHAYYIYINNDKVRERQNIDQRFKDEIMPRIMEKKFIAFLDNNDMEDDAQILQNSFDLLMCICDKKRDDFELLKNLIASYVTINIGDNLNTMELFKYIYNVDLKELLQEINNKKEKGKIFVK